jgi:hypothetical protein
MGYIKPKTVYEAIIQTAYARKQKLQWLVRKIVERYRVRTLFRLFNLRVDYAKAKWVKQKKLKDEK